MVQRYGVGLTYWVKTSFLEVEKEACKVVEVEEEACEEGEKEDSGASAKTVRRRKSKAKRVVTCCPFYKATGCVLTPRHNLKRHLQRKHLSPFFIERESETVKVRCIQLLCFFSRSCRHFETTHGL